MFVKILTRHSPTYESLIRYILRGGTHEVFTHNLRGTTVPGWTQAFLENESFRRYARKDQIYLYHDILSFSDSEAKAHLTEAVLADMARKYIELRGMDGMYLGAVHREKAHVHIHFCTSGLAYRTGTAFRLSREKLAGLKQELQLYHREKYPELSHSTCAHGSGTPYRSSREWQAAQRDSRRLVKTAVAETAQSCFIKATSQQHFFDLLRDAGLHHYERNGQPQGIVAERGMKFRFSRLGIDREKLPGDMSQAQKALAEIRAIRDARKEHREYDR